MIRTIGHPPEDPVIREIPTTPMTGPERDQEPIEFEISPRAAELFGFPDSHKLGWDIRNHNGIEILDPPRRRLRIRTSRISGYVMLNVADGANRVGCMGQRPKSGKGMTAKEMRSLTRAADAIRAALA